MEIAVSEEKKIEILLHALSERYNATHIIRDRVQNVCLWILGLFITASGWLLQKEDALTFDQMTLFSLAIITSVIVVRFFYLRDLEKGFKSQQRMQARIETILGLCRDGVYAENSIYPSEWADAGNKGGKGNFFFHNYLLIYVGTVMLLISIWLS